MNVRENIISIFSRFIISVKDLCYLFFDGKVMSRRMYFLEWCPALILAMSWSLLPVCRRPKDTVLCPQTKYLSWAFSWEPSKLTGEGDDVEVKKKLQKTLFILLELNRIIQPNIFVFILQNNQTVFLSCLWMCFKNIKCYSTTAGNLNFNVHCSLNITYYIIFQWVGS